MFLSNGYSRARLPSASLASPSLASILKKYYYSPSPSLGSMMKFGICVGYGKLGKYGNGRLYHLNIKICGLFHKTAYIIYICQTCFQLFFNTCQSRQTCKMP